MPVSLLCGFLGAGKTTLLKHVLETKHNEDGFKCAVIVNDMAALNIDKSLIDQSALVQSDEVIAMQNGCFCCTLQSDLVEQIKQLAEKNMFNYMLIEASGVSEPSQIAPLFELCDDEHDHDAEHTEGPQLGKVARLDTCVTVIDAAEFYNNLESMEAYVTEEEKGTIAELMTEQVEYSNVIVLNKQDLVTKEQLGDIMDKLTVLNPRARVVNAIQSKVNVMDILNTNLYTNYADMQGNSILISATKYEAKGEEEPELIESCCKKSLNDGKIKCCKSKNDKAVDSGLSQITLGVLPNSNGNQKMTRHEERFGITSFIYRSRRPFHPERLFNQFLEPYFVLRYKAEDLNNDLPEDSNFSLPDVSQLQKEAKSKQEKRATVIGDLLRSKGFIWIATSHNIMGAMQQAGSVMRLEGEGEWMCQMPEVWEGTPAEAFVRKDMTQESGEEYPYSDRRQELVFIGIRMKHQEIQRILDECLLNDEEMAMGPEQWKETMGPLDKIALNLDWMNEASENEEDPESFSDMKGLRENLSIPIYNIKPKSKYDDK